MSRHPAPIVIAGDCLNAEGSRAFKHLLRSRDATGIVELAKQQVAAGAAWLDVSVALADEGGELERMRWAIDALADAIDVPLMIDSADPEVLIDAAPRPSRPPMLNSVTLRDGADLASRVMGAAAARGAGVVGLAIDRDGLARNRERKLAVALSLCTLAGECGLPAERLWIDPLVFPLRSADPAAALETIEGIRRIKEELPTGRVVAGISDAGFGLRGSARSAVERVFLRLCVEAGLDVALANPFRLAKPAHEESERLAEAVIRRGDTAALERLQAVSGA